MVGKTDMARGRAEVLTIDLQGDFTVQTVNLKFGGGDTLDIRLLVEAIEDQRKGISCQCGTAVLWHQNNV